MDCDISKSKYHCLGLSGYPASSFCQMSKWKRALPLRLSSATNGATPACIFCQRNRQAARQQSAVRHPNREIEPFVENIFCKEKFAEKPCNTKEYPTVEIAWRLTS